MRPTPFAFLLKLAQVNTPRGRSLFFDEHRLCKRADCAVLLLRFLVQCGQNVRLPSFQVPIVENYLPVAVLVEEGCQHVLLCVLAGFSHPVSGVIERQENIMQVNIHASLQAWHDPQQLQDDIPVRPAGRTRTW